MKEKIQLYKNAVAHGYRLAQSDEVREKIKLLTEINRERFIIMQGIKQGVELAEWEKSNSKTTTMIDDKVDEDYKKGYNLGYLLNQHPESEQYYKDLISMHTNPKFRETAIYKGMVNGKAQAEKEFNAHMQDVHLKEPYAVNKIDITQKQETPETPPTKFKYSNDRLSPEQAKELKEFGETENAKWDEINDRNAEKKALNEIVSDSKKVSKEVESGQLFPPTKEQIDEEKAAKARQASVDKMLADKAERLKNRGKDRSH